MRIRLIAIILILSSISAYAQSARDRREARRQGSGLTASSEAVSFNLRAATPGGVYSPEDADEQVANMSNPIIQCRCSVNDLISPVSVVKNYSSGNITSNSDDCHNYEGNYIRLGSRLVAALTCETSAGEPDAMKQMQPSSQPLEQCTPVFQMSEEEKRLFGMTAEDIEARREYEQQVEQWQSRRRPSQQGPSATSCPHGYTYDNIRRCKYCRPKPGPDEKSPGGNYN